MMKRKPTPIVIRAFLVAVPLLSALSCGAAPSRTQAPMTASPPNDGRGAAREHERPADEVDSLGRLAEPASTGYVVQNDKPKSVAVHCELSNDGIVSCVWGDEPAVIIKGVGKTRRLVAGHDFVCALERSGKVSCLRTGGPLRTNADRLALPFQVRNVAANEGGLVLESVEGGIRYCALAMSDDGEAPPTCAAIEPLDVPDVDSYVSAGRYRCSLDASRAASCTRGPTENDDDLTWYPLGTPGFPRRVRRLVEGIGSYESGGVVCAIGVDGDLVCFREARQRSTTKPYDAVAVTHIIALPGKVRDLAIGDALGRVVLEDGRVYEIPLSITRSFGKGFRLFQAKQVETKELADAVGGMSCIRYRSGRVTCGDASTNTRTP